MSDLLQQLATYLVTSSHWPRVALIALGLGLTLAGFTMYLEAVRRKSEEEEAPERGYRHEH